MALSAQRWKRVTHSVFPWEAEALEFLRAGLPDCDPYHGWTNFSFIADDGTVNEVDALVVTPRGVFLIEIKSDEGELRGDRGTWTIHKPNGRLKTIDNPLILADRKCKKLKSLLERQPSARPDRLPFIEALIFLSSPDLRDHLPESERIRVCHRDRANAPGILHALKFRDALGQKPDAPLVNRPTLARLARAMDEAGIRPSLRHRRVGDYELKELLAEGPDHAYQDWHAEHVSLKNDPRRVRLYVVSREPAVEPRLVHKTAESEYDILRTLRNEHILEAQNYSEHELGPAILFRRESDEIRLDHYLRQPDRKIPLHLRIDFVRQIADALRYAHGRRVIHRALSPQSILVTGPDTSQPKLKIFNWQAGRKVATTHSSQRTSLTLHFEDWIEEASLVYVAPEALGNPSLRDEVCDIFSLGALAFHIFSGQAPAPNLRELGEILRVHQGLPLPSVIDSPCPALEALIRNATRPDTLLRTESAAAFLLQLDRVEDALTAPADTPSPDPHHAAVGDVLPGNLTIRARLGTGGTAAAFLIERPRDDRDRPTEELVLKVALKPEYNGRLRDELEVLKKLRHKFIVAPDGDLLTFNGLNAFLVERAGDRTLAARLSHDDRLSAEFLQRFGDDLLDILEFLEQKGIPHRDLKPDNIGVREYAKLLHLKLFDFSLSRLPLDNVRAGTPDYMDPFLISRPRWDPHAERFSAAIVLYEMATGALPRWGNGQSAPHLIRDEVTIASNLFDSAVRESLTAFFTRAFRRDPKERFDTASEMRKAWDNAFAAANFTESQQPDPTARTRALAAATLDTPVLSLSLTTRALNILERENINTVADLVASPPLRFRRLRGVGDKTRREIIELIADLQARFPNAQVPIAAHGVPTATDDDTAPLVHSVDDIAAQLLPAESAKTREDRPRLAALLDLADITADRPPHWPSQTEVAEAVHVTRARIGQIVAVARDRWRRNPSLTQVRAFIDDRLTSGSGLMEASELATLLLASRGSTSQGALRVRYASAVARAAAEAERALEKPRFQEARCLSAVLLVSNKELALLDWTRRLGETAHKLAHRRPLPAPARVLETLRALPFPGHLPPLEDARLLRLAATLAGVALSPRLELYPRPLPARDALELSQFALASTGEITLSDLQTRLRDRYPESADLPDRPALDALLGETGYDWTWDPGTQRYRSPGPSTDTSTSYGPRAATTLLRRVFDVPPSEREDFDTARDTEHKLSVAFAQRGHLVLTTGVRDYPKAIDEVVRRWNPVVLDFDRALLDAMRSLARARNISWERVLTADAEPAESVHRSRLANLAADALAAVEAAIQAAGRPVLLVNPGLLARYHQISFVDRLRETPGPGVWLLVAGADTHNPMIDTTAVPLLSSNHWARLTSYWIHNRHRGETA